LKIIGVTSRQLSREPFAERIRKIVCAHPDALILREKDLPPEQYRKLAEEVLKLCRREKVRGILHSHTEIAGSLGASALHVPLPVLTRMSSEERNSCQVLGASCHSVEEARQAETLGCTYLIAGHVFATDCKKGLPGRGADFLAEVCDSVRIPVYAIGGITPERLAELRHTGCAGVCVMSSLMQCASPEELVRTLREYV
jgi:thiamine-phosphate diphosphorylase